MNVSSNCSDAHELGKSYGYLPYMIDRYLEMLGEEETLKLLKFNESPLPTTIRLNSLRSSYERTLFLLNKKRIVLRDFTDLPEGKEVIKSPVPIGATPEYLNGFYMLQGKNSLYPPRILNPQPGEIVGDFAAAPGGKTTHLAQLMKNKGTIIALEVSKKRCRALSSNLSRMGVKNTIVLNMDASEVKRMNIQFDRILLDAPCSGSGVIVSDPSRKSSKSETDLLNYQKLQTKLLCRAVETLKPGGSIVYCTCSLEPEENELVLTSVLEQYDLELLPINIVADPGLSEFQGYTFHQDLKKAVRLYPHKTGGEGFFIAKMVRKK
ncbi:MAG: RsmB/NOP family class I SAM-dependent RNA methyltransferase [Candidatus Heimdallarchaeaceae archaeon]